MTNHSYAQPMHPLIKDVSIILHRHGCLIPEVSVAGQPVSDALHVLTSEGHANVTIHDMTKVTWEAWKWQEPAPSQQVGQGEMTFGGGWTDGPHLLAERIAREVGADFGTCPKGCSGG